MENAALELNPQKHEFKETLFTPHAGDTSSESYAEKVHGNAKSYDKSMPYSLPIQSVSNQHEEVRSSHAFIKEVSELYNEMQPIEEQDIRILGITFGTYIIYEHENSLNFLDFHAAHERKIYNWII